jgi:hypothetical protein
MRVYPLTRSLQIVTLVARLRVLASPPKTLMVVLSCTHLQLFECIGDTKTGRKSCLNGGSLPPPAARPQNSRLEWLVKTSVRSR